MQARQCNFLGIFSTQLNKAIIIRMAMSYIEQSEGKQLFCSGSIEGSVYDYIGDRLIQWEYYNYLSMFLHRPDTKIK